MAQPETRFLALLRCAILPHHAAHAGAAPSAPHRLPGLYAAFPRIDHVVRVRHTFQITPQGKIGTLADRPVFVAIASGGEFTGEAARQPDFLTPYLKAVLGTIGLHDVRFHSAQGTVRGQRHTGTSTVTPHAIRHRLRRRDLLQDCILWDTVRFDSPYAANCLTERRYSGTTQPAHLDLCQRQ